MTKNALLVCIILSFMCVSPAISAYTISDILPEGRITITEITVPNVVNAGERFRINISVQNNRFLPVKLQLRTDLLDGLLQLITKDIGNKPEFTCPGKTTKTMTINCTIREGDIDWYKEEYNIQSVLLQKMPLVGWITRDHSTIQGIHVKSPFGEKDKVRILTVNAPETISENNATFDVSIELSNEGRFDASTWVRVDLVEKQAIIPELEQVNILRGLASERKELGRSSEIQVEKGTLQEITISCRLRETEMSKERFNIEAVLFVNLSGQHYHVDTSTMHGIHHTQPFFEHNYLQLVAGIFGILIALFLIVFIIRILYPAYYIKKVKLNEEKKRIDKRKN